MEKHSHSTMEQCFFFLRGKAVLPFEGKKLIHHEVDFTQMKYSEPH